MKVLIIDDSKTVLMTCSNAIKQNGCVVETSEDIWIMDIIKEFKPDIILMDVNLGATASGPVALKSMNKRNQLEGVCQIIHSSEDELTLQRYAFECGAHGYIQKTPDMDELCSKIEVIYNKFLTK